MSKVEVQDVYNQLEELHAQLETESRLAEIETQRTGELLDVLSATKESFDNFYNSNRQKIRLYDEIII